jgi:hypothetical protein
MGLNTGEQIHQYSTLKSVLEDKKGMKDDGHYFYIIQMPLCGNDNNRIKLGKTANIYNRFKNYQSHFDDKTLSILHLRKFNRQPTTRYGEGGMMLYAFFEQEAKYALRDLNPVKISNGQGVLTEWFDADKKSELIKMFKEFVDNKFSRTDVEKTKKREKSTRAARVDYTEPTRLDPDISEKKIERPKRATKAIDRLKPSSR